ncbi:hypothetical protein SALBM311S_03958 [Streptomyces alboniger]
MDKFLARTERYQTLMTQSVDRLGLRRVDAGGGRSVAEMTGRGAGGRRGQLTRNPGEVDARRKYRAPSLPVPYTHHGSRAANRTGPRVC